MSYTSMVLSNGLPGHQHVYTQHRGPYNLQQQHQPVTHAPPTGHPASTALSAAAPKPSAATSSSASSTAITANQPLLPAISLSSLLGPTLPSPSSYPPPAADVVDTYTRYFAQCRTRELSGHRKLIRCVRWNSTGTKLASGSGDGTVRVYTLQPAIPPAASVLLQSAEGVELKGHSNSAEFVCFNPSRPDQLASASLDGTVKVWDATTGRCVSTVPCPGENITLAWSRDGGVLAVGNKDNAITLIDGRSFTPLVTVMYPYEMNELDFAPQQRNKPLYLLASTGRAQVEVIDATACIQKAKAAAATAGGGGGGKHKMSSPSAVVALDNHAAPVYALATSTDGQLIASGSTDAVVVIRDSHQLAPLCTMLRFDTPIRSVSFGQSGRLIAVGTEGGELEISIIDCMNSVRVWSATLPNEVVSVAFNPVHPLLAYSTDSTERYCIHLFGCA